MDLVLSGVRKPCSPHACIDYNVLICSDVITKSNHPIEEPSTILFVVSIVLHGMDGMNSW